MDEFLFSKNVLGFEKHAWKRIKVIKMKNRKKILLVLSTEAHDGGSHPYALLLAECLAKNSGSKYELVAMCNNSFWRNWCRKNRVTCISQSLPSRSDTGQRLNYLFPHMSKIFNSYLTPMGKLLRKEHINIVLITRQLAFIPNYHVKIVMPVHDLMHRYERRFPEVMEDFDRREIAAKCLASYGNCVLVDSQLGKRQFEESYMRRGARKPHICTLPYIVPEHIRTDQEKYIETPDKYIFYPAQFWKHKNHINLIRAVEILKNEIESIQLVLVGSEKNNLNEIKRYIANAGLENNVTILGFVDNENIIYLYRHAVAMIMPSYFGPTNIPPLEAMALGCPVAVSDKYAMPEQVGDAGLLFDPDSPSEIADCILRLWTDEALREELRQRGYQKVNRWTKKQFEKKLLKIINTL